MVSMVGWHWMSKSGLRNRGGGRAAAMMIIAIDRARDDLDVRRINAFWINYDGAASEERIKESLEEIAERNHDPALARRQGRGAGPAADTEGGARTGGMRQGLEQREGYSTAVALRSREETRRSLRERADGVIWLISQLPLVTLLVTSLGVVNTIIASIRARQWDLGVLSRSASRGSACSG